MTARQMTMAGWVLTGLFALFMLGASIAPKLLGMDVAAQMLADLGWPPGYVLLIGGFELAFLLLYLLPRTSVLGAVLMTALIGGAMATHMRVGSPLFSHTLFGIYLSLFMWGGLWLRLPELRALFPFASRKD
ncbi:MAG: polyhydroxyalkanoate depolymerase [Sphingomonadales bacterium 32-64-17]|nr:MAG: polyhydroxyalkanoate depolymerase [Sphingomonadales bacterium 32-64-17]